MKSGRNVLQLIYNVQESRYKRFSRNVHKQTALVIVVYTIVVLKDNDDDKDNNNHCNKNKSVCVRVCFLNNRLETCASR